MPLGQFVRWLVDETGVSVIVDAGAEDQEVFAEVRDIPIVELLNAVARRLGLSLREQNGVYIIGQSQPQDRGVLVRRVRRLSAEQLTQALQVFGAESGRSVAFSDGLVVVGDKVEVLAKVASMLDQVEATPVPVWVCELHLVGWSRRAAEDFGFDLTPAADLAFGFAVGSSGFDLDLDLGAALDGILRAASERSDVRVSSAPMFVLVDGATSSVVQGDKVPIPRQVTTDQGTTRTDGYDFIQTGTDVSLTLREVDQRRALLDLEIRMSDVRSYVELAPVTGEETFKTTAAVEAGGVYLLGAIVKDRETGEDSVGWRTNDAFSREVHVVQVWCRVYRIAGGLSQHSIEKDSYDARGLLDELSPTEAGESSEQVRPMSPAGKEGASGSEPLPLFNNTVFRVNFGKDKKP
ncbi:Bacterial type II and III secretion system protein [Aeoliella mucimassa]|uniref:Bacterial type II and III secretion system protein n=2 Tax=Aeoliella mucimassa TaxID=2527972 RepID=A0A518AUC6_9BACT|nr:Bacterial type II and III secretion system protein [Aeoliella mucimassa]